MIKTFKVQAEYNDLMYVVLQVDTDKLTPELATQINDFWCYSEDRIDSEDGDVFRAVVRLYGTKAIHKMLLGGGACFKAGCGDCWRRNSCPAKSEEWAKQLEHLLADGQHELFELFGEPIRVIEARVEIPDFDSVELLDITARCA